jgi:hypothetical protein
MVAKEMLSGKAGQGRERYFLFDAFFDLGE